MDTTWEGFHPIQISLESPLLGEPAPAQQPLMRQFMGAHQPIMGASGSGTRGSVAQQMPLATILSVS